MHVSLDVLDLERSVDFYTTLFGQKPSKRRDDYAKFTLAEPELVFSLNPAPRKSLGAPQRLSHLGFQVGSGAQLAAARRRLTEAGLALREEPRTTCCYAVQDKFWVSDPDGNAWEFYEVLADAPVHREPSSASPSPTACCVPGE